MRELTREQLIEALDELWYEKVLAHDDAIRAKLETCERERERLANPIEHADYFAGTILKLEQELAYAKALVVLSYFGNSETLAGLDMYALIAGLLQDGDKELYDLKAARKLVEAHAL